MKHTLILLILICSISVSATNYYVSSAGSNDNSGLTTVLPFQTISRVNTLTLAGNDTVFFRKGDTFVGQITASQSGSSGSPIVFSTYGAGAKPIISGFNTISGWTNTGGGIYSAPTTAANTCKMVTVNGTNTPKGRYPNTGFLTFESKTINSITDNQLSGSPDWTGAEAVVRVNAFVYETRTITSHSGSTLSFANLYTAPTSGTGYFLQNDSKCLDTLGDWYIKDGTIYMYFGAENPLLYTVKAAQETYGIYVNAKNYITIDGLDIQGAATNCIRSSGSTNLTIKNCSVSLSGTSAISLPTSNFAIVQDCTVLNANGSGIIASGTNVTIKNNAISNIALYEGMQSLWQVNGISSTGDNSLIELNSIQNVGYNGILFLGDNTIVRYNKIDGFCTIMTDGGGIYTDGKVVQEAGKVIQQNIILDGRFTSAGTSLTQSGTIGIYLDELDINTVVTGNTVANIPGYGILLHSCHDIGITDNTVFNCSLAQLCFSHNTSAPNQTGINVTGNILVSKEATQKVFMQYSDYNDYLFGSANNNVYARPIDDTNTISIESLATWNSPTARHDLAWWKTFSGYDVNSTKSPYSVPSVDSLYFQYNATSDPVVENISGTYKDVRGIVSYTNTVSIPAHSSVVLLKSTDISVGGAPRPWIYNKRPWIYNGKFLNGN